MSEYLDRLKWLRDSEPPPGNAPNVHSNVSFRKAIDYIERLENQVKDADLNFLKLKQIADNELEISINRKKIISELRKRIPEELFDGVAVTLNINYHSRYSLKPLEVSDVLDAVVRMIKERDNNA